MHVKFIARGTGSAQAAADYLVGELNSTGQLRKGVEAQGKSLAADFCTVCSSAGGVSRQTFARLRPEVAVR